MRQKKRRLRIFLDLRAPGDRERRLTVARALEELGHDVLLLPEPPKKNEDYVEYLRDKKIDAAFLFGNSIGHLVKSDSLPLYPDLLGIPWFTFWHDNPLRYLKWLKEFDSELHKAIFVIDSHVVSQLHGLGISKARYLPIYFVSPEQFPAPKTPSISHLHLVLAGTVDEPGVLTNHRNVQFWDGRMQNIANQLLTKRQQTQWYVDVYDALVEAGMDPWSHEFMLMSNTLMFEQKAMERFLFLKAIAPREVHIVGGGNLKPKIGWNTVFHKKVPPNQLFQVYHSGKINLCFTQWPTACHLRLYEAASSRSFILSEYKEDTVELFEPGKETIMYRSLDEACELIERYSADEKERNRIAEAAHNRFKAEHTVHHRMAHVMGQVEELL